MPRAGRIMPLVIIHFLATEKTNRVISSRCPEWKFRGFGDTFNNHGSRGFLKDDEVRSSSDDRFRKRLLPTQTTKSDVVTEQP